MKERQPKPPTVCVIASPNRAGKTTSALTKLADAAFERAAQKVIERAVESGTPVVVWKEDAVKEVEPRKALQTRKTKEEA